MRSFLDTLWQDGAVVITASCRETFQATLTRPNDFFDIVLRDSSEPVGFITLKQEGQGKYSIVNDTRANSHPGFINTPGHGIEVKKKFRKRGFGAALLSLGIGVVQRHHAVSAPEGSSFEVVASDITGLGLGCYQNFGFHIRDGLQVSSGSYYDPQLLPGINILPHKAGFFVRFKKRLRLG